MPAAVVAEQSVEDSDQLAHDGDESHLGAALGEQAVVERLAGGVEAAGGKRCHAEQGRLVLGICKRLQGMAGAAIHWNRATAFPAVSQRSARLWPQRPPSWRWRS